MGASKGLPPLRWFEDETFYSICCRQHVFLSSLRNESTLEWIFGANPHTIKHDLPGNLDSLRSEVRDTWGSSESIIFQHTILPLFLPFQSGAIVRDSVLSMRGPSIGSLKYRLGLLTSRFSAEHPLKACPSCMDEDRAVNGVAFWHLQHQYPGMVLCPIHASRLRQAVVNRRFLGRFRWALPAEEILELSEADPSEPVQDVLMEFGAAVQALATFGKLRSFDAVDVRSVYTEALESFGHSALDRFAAAASFAMYCSKIQRFPPLGALPATQQSAESLLTQIRYKPRGCWHPLKHVALISWLFGRFESFLEAYDRLDEPRSDRSSQAEPAIEEPTSSSQAVPHPMVRRPKKLKPKMRSEILESLRRGEPKETICALFRISICTLNRLLRAEPLIQRMRSKDLQFNTLLERRATWIKLLEKNPNLSTKFLRALNEKTYAWLYRNDREWLVTSIKRLPSGRIGNNSKVDWFQRDHQLSETLLRDLERYLNTAGSSTINKTLLITLVPGLKCAYQHPKRYLLTKQMLDTLIRNYGVSPYKVGDPIPGN